MNTLPVLTHGNLPVGSLDAYIQRVNAIPLLTQQEEFELATRLQETGDLHAAQSLVLAHLRYVVKVARGFSGYGLPMNDLIQEGTIGLMKAVKRFEPHKGVRLVSFAMHWIKSEMHDFVIKNWRIVKVATTKAQRKLFFNLRGMKKRLGWLKSDEVKTIAKDLDVPEKEVWVMEQRLHANDMSFDLPVESDVDHQSFAPVAYLEATEQDPSQSLIESSASSKAKSDLTQALARLEPRSRDIIQKRWLNTDGKITLSDLAKTHHVSLERIRQIEKQAINDLKDALAG